MASTNEADAAKKQQKAAGKKAAAAKKQEIPKAANAETYKASGKLYNDSVLRCTRQNAQRKIANHPIAVSGEKYNLSGET